MKLERIALLVVFVGVAVLVTMKLYSQYRHIDIFVSRVAPMPAELANGLHMEEHKINPSVRIESPYDTTEEKILSMNEIRQIRSRITWGSMVSPLIDSLTIQDPTNVIARRTTSRSMTEYHLVKLNGKWTIKDITQSEIRRFPAEKN